MCRRHLTSSSSRMWTRVTVVGASHADAPPCDGGVTGGSPTVRHRTTMLKPHRRRRASKQRCDRVTLCRIRHIIRASAAGGVDRRIAKVQGCRLSCYIEEGTNAPSTVRAAGESPCGREASSGDVWSCLPTQMGPLFDALLDATEVTPTVSQRRDADHLVRVSDPHSPGQYAGRDESSTGGESTAEGWLSRRVGRAGASASSQSCARQ